MDSSTIEKRITDRTFYITPYATYEGILPDAMYRQPGVEFYLILAP